MSLTSELSDPLSQLSIYFSHNYNFDSFIAPINKEIKNSYTISPKIKKDYPWSRVGHIVEYLMLIHLGLPINELFPLKYGSKIYLNFAQSLTKKYKNTSLYFTNKEKFYDLCNDLYKLSYIEEVVRRGNKGPLLLLNSLNIDNNIFNDVLQIYFKSLKVNDVINEPKNNFCYNPTFELSRLVGGADADLYLVNPRGNTLIDLKTTLHPIVTKEMLCQLLGYVFLDKSNQHKITDVGIYLTRQNLMSKWNVGELIIKTSSFKTTNEAKQKFIQSIS